jgi:hypothetical protein
MRLMMRVPPAISLLSIWLDRREINHRALASPGVIQLLRLLASAVDLISVWIYRRETRRETPAPRWISELFMLIPSTIGADQCSLTAERI